MSERKVGDALAAHLQVSVLKALGFRKSGHSFWRERIGYIELFAIQGSSWNSGAEPWLFYLNVRVRFSEIVPLRGTTGASAYHADGRIEGIVSSAPTRFEVSSNNVAQVASDLGSLIVLASEALPSLLPVAKMRAERGLFSPLPVPRSWANA
jgi:hypothetical protein